MNPIALLLFLACGATPPEVPMEPSHESVHQAAAAVDAELSAWTQSPEGYVLRPAKRPELTHHRVWFLIPDLPHPMSVYIAQGDGAPFVTTGRPDAVYAVVAAEPELAASPSLPLVVHDLLRDQGRRQKFVEGSGAVAAEGGGWTLTFLVDDERTGRQRWTVRLQRDGSTLTVGEE